MAQLNMKNRNHDNWINGIPVSELQVKPTMSEDQMRFLNLRRLPGLIRPEFVSLLTNHTEEELRFIDEAGILSPLCRDIPNTKKLYAATAVEAYLADPSRLEAGRRACILAWMKKNAGRRSR